MFSNIAQTSLSLFVTALAGLFMTSPAYPWGSKGHEIVTAMAATQLTEAARKRIKELLPQGTTLAEASTWPDKAGGQILTCTLLTSSTSPKTPTPTISNEIANWGTASSRQSPGICRCLIHPMHRRMKRGSPFDWLLIWSGTCISHFMPGR